MQDETAELIVRIDERVGGMRGDIQEIKIGLNNKVDKEDYREDCHILNKRVGTLERWSIKIVIAIVIIGGGGAGIWKLLT